MKVANPRANALFVGVNPGICTDLLRFVKELYVNACEIGVITHEIQAFTHIYKALACKHTGNALLSLTKPYTIADEMRILTQSLIQLGTIRKL